MLILNRFVSLSLLGAQADKLTVPAAMTVFVGWPLILRSLPRTSLWDQSTLSSDARIRWYSNVWIWWFVLAAAFGCIHAFFW